MSVTLKVLDAGPGISLQDNGRPGYQRYGVTEGGVMDRWALAEVNTLLGNAVNTAALEMIAMGAGFIMLGEPIKMATSGAEMDLTVDDNLYPGAVALWCSQGKWFAAVMHGVQYIVTCRLRAVSVQRLCWSLFLRIAGQALVVLTVVTLKPVTN